MKKNITCEREVKEGEIFCKWLESRLIRNNKNVLGANLGPTGSGKSYRDLRMAELWYLYQFNGQFPVKNICFGVGEAMTLLSNNKLRKGEIIIFEEAGVNLGSLDFQNKVSKMMTYVLQSFRSMNIAIFFNLPYLSMLNSSARKLLHYSFESSGIDPETKQNKCKPFFHQVNQDTGKVYKKYPIVKVGTRTRKVKRFNFSMPSQYIVAAYEEKKQKYLIGLTKSFKDEVDKLNGGKPKNLPPKDIEFEAYKLYKTDLTQEEIGRMLGKNRVTIGEYIKNVNYYLNLTKSIQFAKEKRLFEEEIPA